MNLIEQLGGYERAKHEFEMIKEMKPIYPGEIETNDRLLLEYRRQHNIFEVGDLITHPIFWGLFEVIGVMKHHVLGVTPTGYGTKLAIQLTRHATDEEIKAGKGLEVESEN